MTAQGGRPATRVLENPLGVVDLSCDRLALPPGHCISWSAIAQLTPSISPDWPPPDRGGARRS